MEQNSKVSGSCLRGLMKRKSCFCELTGFVDEVEQCMLFVFYI